VAAETITEERTTETTASALLSLARVMNQLKTHDSFCRAAGVDLDRGGAALLYKLFAEGEDVRLGELAERLGVDSPAVTRKVQQLERAGLVTRSPDPDDARASRVHLAPAGRRSIEKLLHARELWLDEVLEGWSEQDRAELARLLQLLATTIARHGEQPRGD
jgi:DNA-binding MarR family transcriptional regulator